MRKNILSIFGIMLLLNSCAKEEIPKSQLVDYVDTKIGVIDDRGSNCVIGPRMPYGSINPSPHTIEGNMDGYHPGQPIRGFGQLQASGAGWGAYGHFLVSPLTGTLTVGLDSHDSSHSGDVTTPYYYKTQLERYYITAEVTPSHYAALYRFTFPKSDQSHLLFDASHAIPTDIVPKMNGVVVGSSASIDPAQNEIRMEINYRGGWVEGAYTLYLVGRYDKRATTTGTWGGEFIMPGQKEISADTTRNHVGAYATFSTAEGEEVMLKVAISFQSYEKADSLLNEIADWDFDKVKQRGADEWNNKLSCIEIETPSDREKTIFYSALYRFFTFTADRTLDAPQWANGRPYWDDIYAMWDTFRTAYPLMMLVDESAMRDNIQAMIDRYEDHGAVYDGFIAGRERTREQGGNDVDNIIAEAYLKGIKGIDWEKAYQIVKYNADNRRIGYHNAQTVGDGYTRYKQQGWIPADVMSTSQTLEFAYNDYCAALMAKGLGHEEDYQTYLRRSHQWTYLWNPNHKSEGYKGFIDARGADGVFAFYDAKKYGGSWKGPFYEGSSWTYSFFAPHDIDKLMSLMGGKEAFADRLNTGHEKDLIDYTNEPSFLATRLFIEADRYDLASYWVHQVMKNKYDLTGYPQNDDTGSMASWYVFSSMGIFPNGGQDFYYLNAPLYRKSVIHLTNGKTLTIEAPQAGEGYVYMKSFKLNGKVLDKPIIRHADIVDGGTIEIEVSNQQ